MAVMSIGPIPAALPVSAQLAAAAFCSDPAQDDGRPEGQLWLHWGSTIPPNSSHHHSSSGDLNGSNGSPLCCTGQFLQASSLLEQLRQIGALPGQLVHEVQHSHLARQHVCGPAALQLRQVSFFDAIVQQLDEVGWHQLLSMSEDLSRIELGVHDAAGRLHKVRVQLPPGFPSAAPDVALQLPEKAAMCFDGGHALSVVVQHVQQALSRYQALWDALDDLDQHTQVLEPHPDAPCDYSCYSRRISLSRHASLHLTLNPTSPANRPAVTFLGSDAAVCELQRHWFGSGSHKWDPNCSLRANIEAALQLELPERKQQGKEDQEDRSSCAICFGPAVAGDPGSVASVVCGAAACGRAFHPRCLVEWLQSVTSTRCFRTLFGECPYCNASISVALDG